MLVFEEFMKLEGYMNFLNKSYQEDKKPQIKRTGL